MDAFGQNDEKTVSERICRNFIRPIFELVFKSPFTKNGEDKQRAAKMPSINYTEGTKSINLHSVTSLPRVNINHGFLTSSAINF